MQKAKKAVMIAVAVLVAVGAAAGAYFLYESINYISKPTMLLCRRTW